ncbi:MAG: hypothetical protein JRN21_09430 [Nitrososphaerota archaeon]|nr:hypothetical protein [Nitrososphaerota archaeon]
MKSKTYYVAVILWQGCIDSVKLCSTKAEAHAFFKTKTGINYAEATAHTGDGRYNYENWIGSDIFTLKAGNHQSGNAPGRG